MLFETLFGEGQFKSAALKKALKGADTFRAAVQQARNNPVFPPNSAVSDTEALLATATSIEPLIDLLVDKRGFYFHGHANSKRAWRQDQQESAKGLAEFALDIVQALGMKAAQPLFADELAAKHFNSAKAAGAMHVLNIDFAYRQPEEAFDRQGQVNYNVPGAKPTGALAAEIAREFLHRFTQDMPQAALRRARGTVGPDHQPVFTLEVHVA